MDYVKSYKWIGIVLVLAILAVSFTYQVAEGEQAIQYTWGVMKKIIVDPDNDYVDDLDPDTLKRLGNVEIVKDKGLRFKVPFVHKVVKYDSRLLTYINQPEVINTLEKKQYLVSLYAQWRIANPGLFAMTHGTPKKANVYLDSLIYPTIIHSINRISADDFTNNKDVLNQIIEEGIVAINEKVKSTGIVVADIEIHRTMLPNANIQSTYQKMITNRQAVAQQIRSEGEEEYNKIVSSTDRQAKEIESNAIEEAERLKGEADAAALEIYAKAYSKDVEFYTYWRSLKALEKAIDENTVIVLDKNNPLWKDIVDWIEP